MALCLDTHAEVAGQPRDGADDENSEEECRNRRWVQREQGLDRKSGHLRLCRAVQGPRDLPLNFRQVRARGCCVLLQQPPPPLCRSTSVGSSLPAPLPPRIRRAPRMLHRATSISWAGLPPSASSGQTPNGSENEAWTPPRASSGGFLSARELAPGAALRVATVTTAGRTSPCGGSSSPNRNTRRQPHTFILPL